MKLDFWGLSKRPYTQQYKSIIFYPKLWYPEAWFPVVYSISLLSCMVKYKDASKDKSNLIPLNTLFFRRPVVSVPGPTVGPQIVLTKSGVLGQHFIARQLSLYWEGDLRNPSYFLNKRKELEFLI